MSEAPVIQAVESSGTPLLEGSAEGALYPQGAEVREQLRRILTSKIFAKSGQLRRLLRHLVETSLAGSGSALKETVLGMDVFGRGLEFDPRIDPIVRVEARRLRSRLKLYYDEEGSCDPVVIHLEPGSYLPSFHLREPGPLLESESGGALPGRTAAQNSADDECTSLCNQAMVELSKGTIERGMFARQLLQQAVEQWPKRPEPHAGLSQFFLMAGLNLIAAKTVLFAQAREAALRALELNSENATAHAVLGSLQIVQDYDFASANEYLLQAMRVEPDNLVVRNLRSNLWLMPLGFLSSAEDELSHGSSVMSVPGGLGRRFGLAQALYLQRRPKEAIAWLDRILEQNPVFPPALALLAFAYDASGQHEMLAQFQADQALIPYPLLRLWMSGCLALAADGWERTRDIVRQMEAQAQPDLTEPVLIANLLSRLQEYDRAFTWLDHAYETRALRLLFAETDPLFDPLRKDPQFPGLLSRINVAVVRDTNHGPGSYSFAAPA